MLCEIKDLKDYKANPYLEDITNPKHRKTITKLRTSSHSLASETGNYYNDNNDPKNFLCKMCNSNENESVEHFLIKCPNPKLTHYKTKIHRHITQRHSLPPSTKINADLIFQNLDNTIARHVHFMYTDRINLMQDNNYPTPK